MREAKIRRETAETKIELSLNLDGDIEKNKTIKIVKGKEKRL